MPSTPEHPIPVIFRHFNGEVIALFPTLPGTNDPYTCSSYMHVGQHSSADPIPVITASRPATPSEYAPLLLELTSPPYSYSLTPCLRHIYYHLRMRRSALARLSRP